MRMKRPDSFYGILLQLAQKQSQFKSGGYCDLLTFDLKHKRIFNGKTILMEGGKLTNATIELTDGTKYKCSVPLLSGSELMNYGYPLLQDKPWQIVEQLYQEYKRSVPSEHSGFGRLSLHAVNVDELSDLELLNNSSRTFMKYVLEGFILLGSVTGTLVWSDLCKNEKYWFYKMQDKDLVMCKEWF